LEELLWWAVDACEQGTGQSITTPFWHAHMSTWEEAEELLPRVAGVLGLPSTLAELANGSVAR
jgi:hypothetical protein